MNAIDTNVLVYRLDQSDLVKQAKARQLLRQLAADTVPTVLPWQVTERFKQELDQLEESLQMPYVTSVERLTKAEGIAEGKSEGIAEGGAMVLLKPLGKLCGPLPEEVQRRIHETTWRVELGCRAHPSS